MRSAITGGIVDLHDAMRMSGIKNFEEFMNLSGVKPVKWTESGEVSEVFVAGNLFTWIYNTLMDVTLVFDHEFMSKIVEQYERLCESNDADEEGYWDCWGSIPVDLFSDWDFDFTDPRLLQALERSFSSPDDIWRDKIVDISVDAFDIELDMDNEVSVSMGYKDESKELIVELILV